MKKSSVVIIALSVVLLAGAAIVSSLFLRRDRNRSVMYFTSFGTDDVCTEVRYLPVNQDIDPVVQFVEELVLGHGYPRLSTRKCGSSFALPLPPSFQPYSF